ncbi:hypothetical protein ETB97_001953 [Aspergillus alliaceus]|uniref:Uncharacterized protein n=1 Tax=Petromyces alliaceus TaxID=209559 RepID=A0A8H6AF28_PETAA|nr:hypothetical protein ETB97_001953 [Aspergillus burnettii]
MDKKSTSGTTSSTQQPTHLDLAEYQAEWARIHENTIRQIEQFKGAHARQVERLIAFIHSDLLSSQQTDPERLGFRNEEVFLPSIAELTTHDANHLTKKTFLRWHSVPVEKDIHRNVACV